MILEKNCCASLDFSDDFGMHLSFNPMKMVALAVSILLFCSGMSAFAQTGTGRRELEPVLKAYLAAEKSGDMNAVLPILAASEIAAMRNSCAVNNESFPPQVTKDSDAWEMAKLPFDTLNFVALKKNDLRAFLIYFHGGVSDGSGQNNNEFYIADFVHEKAGWKFLDVTRTRDDAQAAKLKAGDMTFLDRPEYTPSATIPPMPTPVSAPDYRATLDFFALAEKVVLTVNGVSTEIVADSGSRIMPGGLKKGTNTVRVVYQPAPGKLDTGVNKLRIKIVGRQQKQLQVWVYKWNDSTGKYETTFDLDDEKLSALPNAEAFY